MKKNLKLFEIAKKAKFLLYQTRHNSIDMKISGYHNVEPLINFSEKTNQFKQLLKQAEEIEEKRKLIEEQRKKINKAFTEFLQQGIKEFKEFKLKEALQCFNNIINAFSDTPSLYEKEKEILAEAYTYKANIIRHRSLEEEKEALQLLEKAIKLNPHLKMAVEIRQSIMNEFTSSIPDSYPKQ